MVSPEELIILPKLQGTANLYRMTIGMGLWVWKNRKKLKQYDTIFLYGAESYLALYLIKSVLKLKAAVVLHSNGLEVHVKEKLEEYKEYLKHTKKKWYHFNTDALFKYCYKHVDAILTVSQYDADYATKSLGINPDKVFFIEPALPEVFFANESETPKKPIITFCGSWIDRKGIDSMVVALPRVLRNHPEYTFRIIGAGHSFKAGEVFPADVLNNIDIIPFVEKKTDLIKYYNESLIFIHPSVCESFGLTVAEAMFCGCAVVTGATGIAASLKDKEEAMVLVQPNDVNLQNSIELLIKDSELVEKLNVNGKKRAHELQWKHFESRLNNFLSKLTA
jgi:glycosyltransferase involved in cell wall biosynthesis